MAHEEQTSISSSVTTTSSAAKQSSTTVGNASMEGREGFSNRLGFLLISAGCAIGLGNIWRFPYITGEYGGAAFVLLHHILSFGSRFTRIGNGICSRSSKLSFYCA